MSLANALIEESSNIQFLEDDEREILRVYRRAKDMGHADISVSIQEGNRVKLWLTEKMR